MKEVIINIFTKEETSTDETMVTTYNATYDFDKEKLIHLIFFDDVSGEGNTKTKLSFDEHHIEIEKDGTDKVSMIVGDDNEVKETTLYTMYGQMPMRIKSNFYNLNIEEDVIKVSMGYNLTMSSQIIGDMTVYIEVKFK